MPVGGVSVRLSAEVTAWRERMSADERAAFDRRMRELAAHPERAMVAVRSGEHAYSAVHKTLDGALYRVVFVVDELMRQRARVPAIAVGSIKRIR